MILTLDAKRRLTLPASLFDARPGDHFEAVFDAEEDALIFRRLPKARDWLEVMKACPVKIDELPARSREYPKRRKL
jgi:bifunctional DNA-binding transcriptional regulator/antitoxin component of YhaV-PrlF toxin-antitoxin module